MKITFEQTGGFVATRRGCSVDLKELPASLRTDVEKLLRTPPGEDAKDGVPADIPRYRIVAEGPQGQSEVTLSETNIPEGAREVIEFLRARSHPLPIRE